MYLQQIKTLIAPTILCATVAMSPITQADEPYATGLPMESGAQASFDSLHATSGKLRIAYLPPATEFAYYIAIGEGLKSLAAEQGVDTFMLAPQSGADINGQMGMLQDVIGQGVDAIILSTHDEQAAAPLVKRAVNAGIVVITVNSDIRNFPTPVHGVVGYGQRNGTRAIGEYAVEVSNGKAMKVAIIEGQPGYHSTERVEGFLEGIDGSNFEVVSSIDGKWNVEGGNTAGMDLLQANPEIDMIFAANDYMIMGAALAAKALGRSDIVLLGNDGDTTAIEQVNDGTLRALVNTTPFVMGRVALQVALDSLSGKFAGGWVETPTVTVDGNNAIDFLSQPEKLYPQPSKKY